MPRKLAADNTTMQ